MPTLEEQARQFCQVWIGSHPEWSSSQMAAAFARAYAAKKVREAAGIVDNVKELDSASYAFNLGYNRALDTANIAVLTLAERIENGEA